MTTIVARHSLILGLALALASAGAAAEAPPQVLVFARANLIDGVAAQPLRNMTVVVRDGRIERVSEGPVDPPAGARVIDLDGRWLLPGFIDAHVHLRDLASARTALRSGVTTARSLGVSHFVDVGIRELHRAGAADLPDVIAAGYHVRRRLAEEIFLDSPPLHRLMRGVSGPDDVREVIRALAGRGVNVIKVMVTERAGMPETDPLRRVLTDEELAAAVDEASRAGLPVAAHAHSDEGARAAVRAGVRSIEHGTLLGETTLALMKERGVCFVPTLSFWLDMLEPGGEYDNPALAARARTLFPRLRETIALAWKMDVKLAAGSDMRYDADGGRRIADEIAGLVASGMPPMGAIRAATSTAAECLGVEGRTGAIRPGLEADLIVAGKDPLADIATLRDLVLVVNDGRVVVDQLGK